VKVYLAGPMRNVPLWNFPAFDYAQALLEGAGHQVFNPAQHDRAEGLDENDYPELPDWFTLEKALQWDFARIIEAGNICLLDGWETSSGTAKELRVAEDIGARVWRLQGETLVEWNYGIVHESQTLRQATASSGDPNKVQWTTDPGPQVAIRTGEHRVVDPVTGGAKGAKPAKLGALDPLALEQLALVCGMGEDKYGRFNYAKGFKWSLAVDALYRHLLAFLGGEDLDSESGLPHTAHVAWQALCLTTFLQRKRGTDDRFPT